MKEGRLDECFSCSVFFILSTVSVGRLREGASPCCQTMSDLGDGGSSFDVALKRTSWLGTAS